MFQALGRVLDNDVGVLDNEVVIRANIKLKHGGTGLGNPLERLIWLGLHLIILLIHK